MLFDSFDVKEIEVSEADTTSGLSKLHSCFESAVEPIEGAYRDADISDEALRAYEAALNSGKNVTYVQGRALLGAGEFFEDSAETASVWIDCATGNREAARNELEGSFFEDKADEWTEFMAVDDSVVAVGDGAEVVGEAAAGLGVAAAAAAAIAATSVPVGVGAGLAGVASLGAAGESLDVNFEKSGGEVTDEMLVESAVVAAGTAASIAVPAGIVRNATSVEKVISIECRNKELAGKVHPETGVLFEGKRIVQDSGKVVEGVFPKFDSAFTAKIEPADYNLGNPAQFKKCNAQLYEAIENNPSLGQKFSKVQIEQIKDGIHDGSTPDGWVWHHNEVEGIIELVDSLVHSKTAHTGGRSIWCGGYRRS